MHRNTKKPQDSEHRSGCTIKTPALERSHEQNGQQPMGKERKTEESHEDAHMADHQKNGTNHGRKHRKRPHETQDVVLK